MTAPRALDLFILAITLPLTAALAGVIALAIWIIDGRPVFFRQQRAGQYARPFTVLKFRTMVENADELLADDGTVTASRVTAIGRPLRRLGLDELPQLVNVARGQMSLVGPRPILPDWVDRLPGGSDHPRFSVPPGLTGPAQVAGRNMVMWSRRMELDAEYVRNRSLATNLRWLAQTPWSMVASTVSDDRNKESVDDLDSLDGGRR